MPPRVLVIDDLFGRRVEGAVNAERRNLCAHLLLRDVTEDPDRDRSQIRNPTAEAVFHRGQSPVSAGVGDVVENDVPGSLALVQRGWTAALKRGVLPWAMVLLDLCFYTGPVTERSHRRTLGMPEGRADDDDPRRYFGLTLLETIHAEFPDLPVMILSSKPREEVSLEFSRRGALGFIARDDLRGPELLADALSQHGLLPDSAGEVIGNSLPVLLALREARRAAPHRANLLIRGERGSGKELLANYIHRVSVSEHNGAPRPWVAVNAAGLTPNLFASELFGIEPKTATGVEGKIGLIEAADGGDLFLDEIVDMPPEVQAAVLRVLQERQITQVGARRPKTVDVRFLAATNADLDDGLRIRPDLLDRLRLGGTLWLPPLRERTTDIPLLAETFVREAEDRRRGARRRDITPEALEVLQAHDWPGNIRELRACLLDAVNRHPDVEHLVADHLRITGRISTRPGAVVSPAPAAGCEPGPSRPADVSAFLDLQARMRFDQGNIAAWSGRLPELQRSHAWVVARLLEAALDATKRRTPEHPEGLIQIHPAVKLATGNRDLTASQAADVVKRLLGPLAHELEGDLLAAYSVAVRLRPKTVAGLAGGRRHNRSGS